MTGLPAYLSLPQESHWQNLPGHPRLFADASQFKILRERNDSVSRDLFQLLMHQAERHLEAEPIVYPASGFMLFQMREMQQRMVCLSMAFRLSDDHRFLIKAREELRVITALEDWGTGHFLDVAECALAAGVGLDWLHDELSDGDRNQVVTSIIERAILPSLAVPDVPQGWLHGNFNWTQVCHCGVVVGALAIAEYNPELARQVTERAIRNFDRVGLTYSPDGSCAEGPSYWSYGTSFHVLLIEALRSALGTSCGLEKFPGFLETHQFRTQMVGATGTDFDFADYHVENFNEPVFFWFARELQNRHIAKAELSNLQQLMAGIQGKAINVSRTVVVTRLMPFELLWWDPALPEAGDFRPLHWTADGTLPIAIMRSSWDDPYASFLGLKGGSSNHSHAHMDAGSFILEAAGVRWAIDLGTEDYDKMRSAKIDIWNYAQDSTRWNTFRAGPEGHNILRFDQSLQNVNGYATIKTVTDQNGAVTSTADLTTLYQPRILSAQRTVQLFPDRSMAIQDRWSTGNQPTMAAFQWLTHATVTRIEKGLRLHQEGRWLDLRIDASPVEFDIRIQDMSLARADQDSCNPSLKRIVIYMHTPANSMASIHISVKADQ